MPMNDIPRRRLVRGFFLRRIMLSLVWTAAVAGFPGAIGAGPAQSASSADPAQGAVVLVRLSPPIYPPIAASARVSGDVEVNIRVRPDGSVESATIVSGPPLLQQAASDAARQSAFECRGCSETAMPYSLVFAFQLDGGTQSTTGDDLLGTVTETPSQSRVTIVAETPLAIVDFASVTARSAKCLYLWRCGSRWGGYDFYYVPVRSVTCLWLWKCGFTKR
jgi:TonB family protein